jgi:hypothetical protein
MAKVKKNTRRGLRVVRAKQRANQLRLNEGRGWRSREKTQREPRGGVSGP